MSKVIRIDPEVGTIIFKARLILSDQRPGQRVTVNEATKVLLGITNLHRIGQGPPHQAEPDPVEPPCEVAS